MGRDFLRRVILLVPDSYHSRLRNRLWHFAARGPQHYLRARVRFGQLSDRLLLVLVRAFRFYFDKPGAGRQQGCGVLWVARLERSREGLVEIFTWFNRSQSLLDDGRYANPQRVLLVVALAPMVRVSHDRRQFLASGTAVLLKRSAPDAS